MASDKERITAAEQLIAAGFGSISSVAIIAALGYTPYNAANPAGYINAAGAPVQSVAGKVGAVALVVGDVAGAYPSANPAGYITAAALGPYAPINSPAFTGVPTAPTPAVTVNTTQLATTSFVRSMCGTVNPFWLGALGDDVHDDTAALQAAFNDGREVELPSGIYKCTAALTSAGKNLSVRGGGMFKSVLHMVNQTDGITFTGVYDEFTLHQLRLEGLGIKTGFVWVAGTAATQNTAGVRCNNNLSIGPAQRDFMQAVKLRNLDIGHATGQAAFQYGAFFDNAPQVVIESCSISTWHYDGFGRSAGSFGVIFKSTATFAATDLNLENCYLYQCDTGVAMNLDATAANNRCEGLRVANCTLLNNRIGVWAGRADQPLDGRPLLQVYGCHIASQFIGVRAEVMTGLMISKSNFISIYGGDPIFHAIYIASGVSAYQLNSVIDHNVIIHIVTGGYAATYGVTVVGNGSIESLLIDANVFNDFTNAINLDAATNGVRYTASNYVVNGGGPLDAGAAGANMIDVPLQTTTPVPTATVGAFTTVSSVVTCDKKGRFASFNVTITDTTNNTAAGAIVVVLPFTATTECVFAGRQMAVGGNMCQGYVAAGTNQLVITRYDNAYPGSSGERISLSGVMHV